MATPIHRRPLMLRVAMACALLALAACAPTDLSRDTGAPLEEGGYTGPPVTIEYWNGFTGGDGPYMRAMVDQFNETHDNITVKSNTLGWTDFYQRIVAAVHAGQGPDVAAMQLDNLATQASRSVIVPMDDAITEMGFCAPEELNDFVADGNIQASKLPDGFSHQFLDRCLVRDICLYCNRLATRLAD